MSEPTPAELAAQPPVVTAEPTPAEIAMQGIETPQETPPRTTSAPAPVVEEKPAEEPVSQQEQSSRARYDAQLEALMTKARTTRDQQQQSQKPPVGNDLVEALKELGVGPRQKIDIDKILNPPKDDELPQVKELKSKVDQLDNYISELRQQGEQQQQQRQQQERAQWEQQELGNISSFIEKNKENFEYVAAAKTIGSDRDLYNGMISMHNQGYSPEHSEMADLVEARIEQLIELAAGTPKFAKFVQQKFGVQLDTPNGATRTLSEGLKSEGSPEAVDFTKMTDDEQRQYALKQALAARDEAVRKLGL